MVAGREVTSMYKLLAVAEGVDTVVATEGHQGLHQQQGLTELQERHTLLPLLLAQPTPRSIR